MAQLTIEEFAQSIKKKYPQYAQIPDAELTGKILAKYPQYRSQIRPAGREAASASTLQANRPEFEQPGYAPLKSVLDAPLDVGIGFERMLGIDPMHPISSLPGAVGGLIQGMGRLGGTHGPLGQLEALKGMVTAPVEATQRGGTAIREQNLPELMQSIGELYGMVKPAVEAVPSIESLREVATAEGLPEALQTRAAANKVKLPSLTWQQRIPSRAAGGALGFAIGGGAGIFPGMLSAEVLSAIRRSNWYRGMKASGQEAAARALASKKGSVASIGIDEAMRPRAFKPWERPTLTPTSPRTIAADEVARIRQASNQELEPEPEAPYTPPPLKPPTTPGFLKDELARMRQDLEVDPAEFRTKAPVTRGEDIPFETAGKTSPSPPNFKAIEEKIAPSGARAKQASIMVDAQGNPTAFGKKLIDVVPEIATAAKGPRADAALMEGYRRVVQDVNEVEDRIPEGTTVDKIPIVSQLTEMAGDYASRGLGKVAESIERLAEQWIELPDRIPWGDFLARKRAFFQGQNLRSAPMRRAYGVLMEASGRAAPELAEANSRYSTVRRALDNAQIDVNTGRRIRDVGKGGKSSAIPMSERGEPPVTPPSSGPTGEGPKPLPSSQPTAGAGPFSVEYETRGAGRDVRSPAPETYGTLEEAQRAAARFKKKGYSVNIYNDVTGEELALAEPVKTPQEARELLGQPKPMLGETTEEAMRIAAAGRRPELLKEGKQFDETGLVNSPLFQGRGGPQGFLGTDIRSEPVKPATKIGGALPNPEVEASAVNDMKFFADDIRQMQAHREKVSGGGATTGESNVAGKELEENLSAEWSKVGKSLGLKPPPGLEDMSPGRIAKAVEKGKGADFERVKKAFMDAAKSGFSAYRESQRESGTGPGELRRRALALMRKRLERP